MNRLWLLFIILFCCIGCGNEAVTKYKARAVIEEVGKEMKACLVVVNNTQYINPAQCASDFSRCKTRFSHLRQSAYDLELPAEDKEIHASFVKGLTKAEQGFEYAAQACKETDSKEKSNLLLKAADLFDEVGDDTKGLAKKYTTTTWE